VVHLLARHRCSLVLPPLGEFLAIDHQYAALDVALGEDKTQFPADPEGWNGLLYTSDIWDEVVLLGMLRIERG